MRASLFTFYLTTFATIFMTFHDVHASNTQYEAGQLRANVPLTRRNPPMPQNRSAIIALSVVASLATVALVLVLLVFYLRHRQQRKRRQQRRLIYPFSHPEIMEQRIQRVDAMVEKESGPLGRLGIPSETASNSFSRKSFVDLEVAIPNPIVVRHPSMAASTVVNEHGHDVMTPSSAYTYAQTLVSASQGYGYADRMFMKAQEMRTQELLDGAGRKYSSTDSASIHTSLMRQSFGMSPETSTGRKFSNLYVSPMPPLPDILRPGSRNMLGTSSMGFSSHMPQRPAPSWNPSFGQAFTQMNQMTVTSDVTLAPIRGPRPRLHIRTGSPPRRS